ncbi:MAG: hypothetical protein L0G70_08295 [Rubrobacter sp.]|nr:hypothetical protein [Rubrobacter sp.]
MIAVEHAVQPATKDFLIYRVIAQDGHAEIAGESSLETEARRFAGVMEASEPEEGVCYEVRDAVSDELLFSTR